MVKYEPEEYKAEVDSSDGYYKYEAEDIGLGLNYSRLKIERVIRWLDIENSEENRKYVCKLLGDAIINKIEKKIKEGIDLRRGEIMKEHKYRQERVSNG